MSPFDRQPGGATPRSAVTRPQWAVSSTCKANQHERIGASDFRRRAGAVCGRGLRPALRRDRQAARRPVAGVRVGTSRRRPQHRRARAGPGREPARHDHADHLFGRRRGRLRSRRRGQTRGPRRDRGGQAAGARGAEQGGSDRDHPIRPPSPRADHRGQGPMRATVSPRRHADRTGGGDPRGRRPGRRPVVGAAGAGRRASRRRGVAPPAFGHPRLVRRHAGGGRDPARGDPRRRR